MSNASEQTLTFADLGLNAALLKALSDVGYETPSPIQAESIPYLLSGQNLLGQAQTGTGKTAAFALPMLHQMDVNLAAPQLLVLTPTRELAIQVAEAFQGYAKYYNDFHVLPIYGGQGYQHQVRMLKRGVQVVVGTPGRLMDLMEKGLLKLDSLKAMVLDEADEMLRMGFIDDVEWILERTPEQKQVALFSATMPIAIKKIVHRYLKEHKHVKIESKTQTASTITQKYWMVSGIHKLEALTRVLETEGTDASIIFVRTKTSAEDIATRLQARGYGAVALHGDIPQNLREKAVERVKDGKIDILVATDVVARGLDISRLSHVINFDIPHDVESYVHRIGRTGRAGRSGVAILFVEPRERRLLKAIERHTSSPMEIMEMPTIATINTHRQSRIKQDVQKVLQQADLDQYYALMSEFVEENEVDPVLLAAAVLKMMEGEQPLFMPARDESRLNMNPEDARGGRDSFERRPARERGERSERAERPAGRERSARSDFCAEGMKTYKLDVGLEHGAKVGNVVGAIANEGPLPSSNIHRIRLFDHFTLVDLPSDLSADQLSRLKKARVAGRPLALEEDRGPKSGARTDKPPRRFNDKPRVSGERSERPASPFDRGDRKPLSRKPRAPRD
jgi:ATP-dependent RNA helicase DeaD